MNNLRNGTRTKSILEKTRALDEVQRRIRSHNSRNGQHRVVRVVTDIQNRPEPFMLEAIAGGIDVLFLRRLSSTWYKRISARFQALTVPYYLARVNRPRGKKHGETQWQQDHWKAVDARRGAWKHNKGTIVIRWQEDEKCRNSQQAHGWTQEYCRNLDYLTTIDISYTASLFLLRRTIFLLCM